jgi:HPt (histidine-containing phosphotransfer) domain-containing protein
MSANVYKEDKIAAEEAGMNDFIEKPLEKIDIETTLVKLIEQGFGEYTSKNINYKKIVKNNLRENFDETIATQLCLAAMNSISEGLENIIVYSKEKDLGALTDEYHRLKGVLLNLGLKDFANQASSLQKYAKDEDMLALDEYKEPFTDEMVKLLSDEE